MRTTVITNVNINLNSIPPGAVRNPRRSKEARAGLIELVRSICPANRPCLFSYLDPRVISQRDIHILVRRNTSDGEVHVVTLLNLVRLNQQSRPFS
jgi:hypothetical protein